MKATLTDPRPAVRLGGSVTLFVRILNGASRNGECSSRCASDESSIRKWHFYIQDSRKVSAHATPLISHRWRRQEKEIRDAKGVLNCLSSSCNDA